MLGSNRPSDNQVEGCVEALGDFRLPVPGETPLPRGRFFTCAIRFERSFTCQCMVFGFLDCAGQQSSPLYRGGVSLPRHGKGRTLGPRGLRLRLAPSWGHRQPSIILEGTSWPASRYQGTLAPYAIQLISWLTIQQHKKPPLFGHPACWSRQLPLC